MKKVSINRVKAKIRKYRITKTQAKSSMIEGNVNQYIADLFELYNTRNQLTSEMVSVPVSEE